MLPRDELRELVRSKIRDDMTPDEAADAATSIFYGIDDEWERLDVSVLRHGPDTEFLDQRWLVCRVPRESRRVDRIPDRRISTQRDEKQG